MKLWNKIIGVFIGLSMALGVGVLFNFNKMPLQVKAEASYFFTGDTITFSQQGLENGKQYSDPFTNGTVSVQFGGGGNDGKYYTTGSGMRTYGGGTITCLSNDQNINKLTFTWSGSNKPTSEVSDPAGFNEDFTEWTGDSKTVVLTRPSGTGHWRLQSIHFTLAGSTPIEPPTTDHEGTIGDPYSVADSRAMIDYQVGSGTQIKNVYVTGIVSKIAFPWSEQYNNISFYFSDDGTENNDMEAYRCGGEDGANVEVGDTVVVHGDFTKYGSTYELAQGCELISLVKPATPIDEWCNSFLTTVTCDATGVNPPSKTAWATVKASFTLLSDDDKLALKTLSNDATERYDYIIGKYGSSEYEDFIGRKPIAPIKSVQVTPQKDTAAIVIIAAISVIALSSIGIIFLRKKKYN